MVKKFKKTAMKTEKNEKKFKKVIPLSFEEGSDEAIQRKKTWYTGLLRYARNDGQN